MKRQDSAAGGLTTFFVKTTVIFFGVCFGAMSPLSCVESDSDDDVDDSSSQVVVDETCGDVTCSEAEYCDKTVTPPVCRPPATGQGVPCQSQEDCAGYEADFCETYVSNSCLVKECDVALNNCSNDYLCCGFADKSTYDASWILPVSLCVNKEGTQGYCWTQ